jgi:hypothetical protein
MLIAPAGLPSVQEDPAASSLNSLPIKVCLREVLVMLIRSTCVCALLCSLAGSALYGQSTFGSLIGTATDKGGAVVPDVIVKVKNLDDNSLRSALTTDQGLYSLLNLRPGNYELTAERQGFSVVRIASIALEARQQLRLDLTLEIAAVGQVMVVSDTPPALNTENGTIADSKNFRQVTTLPINYRGSGASPLTAILTVPGVQQDAAGNYSIGGGLPSMIEFTADGVSTVNVRSNGALGQAFPSSELIQEFKVTSVNNNAEFAQVGDVTITTKSGTNQLHGSAYDYHQNRALDATTYNSRVKQAKVWNNFGGTIGGPVWIPKLYNGRDKTFFLFAYEGSRKPGSAAKQFTVPAAAMRSGDLSSVPGGAAIDPSTGAPFPGNRIPTSQLNPVTQKLLQSIYPLPNTEGGIASNLRTLLPLPASANSYDVKIDRNIGSRQQIYGRYTFRRLPSFGDNGLLPTDTITEDNRNMVVSYNASLKPTLINEFRFGFSLWKRDLSFPINGTAALRDLGITGLDVSNHPNSGAYPAFNFSDGTGFTSIVKGKDGPTQSRSWQFTDNFSWIKGSHTFKFGVDIRKMSYADVQHFGGSDDFGQFTFNRGAFTGNAFADLLLGVPTTTFFSITGPDLDSPVGHYRFYAQDEWKVSSRITLSYGLRWQLHPPFTEKFGNITNFDRTNGNVIIPDGALAAAPGFLASINACPGTNSAVACSKVITSSQAGLGLGLRETYRGNYAPRMSIAWRPFGNNKTVLRGGFGIFTQTVVGPLAYALTGIHTADTRTFVNTFAAGQPAYRLPQAVAGNVRQPAAGTGDFILGTNIDYRDPQTAQWNLTVERELPLAFSLRVSYIGSNSFRLHNTVDLNQVAPSTTAYNPSSRPFLNWQRILSRDNVGFANYQAMQVEGNRRFSNGWFLQSSYVWAKNLSNNGGPVPTGFPDESGATVNNRFGVAADRGNVAFTRRHRFLLSSIYSIPIGKDRKFGASIPRWADAVVGGWELSTITMLQTGPFMTPRMSAGSDRSNTNVVGRGVAVRPDRLGNGNTVVGESMWDIGAFAVPPAGSGRFGTAGVGILTGPGTVAIAGGLAKNFQVTERLRLRLESTFTNLPNRPNFAAPATDITTPATFGRRLAVQTSENSGNRTGQVALRLDF